MIEQVRVAAVQAEPRWHDLSGGVDKVIDLMDQAAQGGANLVAFPETFIPGFPHWLWLNAAASSSRFVRAYFENSMSRDSDEMRRIAEAAGRHGMHVVLGFSERDGGSLYMAQAIIDDTGSILSVRRKLKPTSLERSLFGEGDGSDLRVHQTKIGRLGALNCWEHLQPLTRYAMYSLGEQIHVASWPAMSVYNYGGPRVLVNDMAGLMYAVEGQTFVVACTQVIGNAAYELFCDTDAKKSLLRLGGGFARVYGPLGNSMGTALAETEEGLVYADLDFSLITFAKSSNDPVGHYSRPDVFRLYVNRSSNPRVVFTDDDDRFNIAEAGVSLKSADS